MIRSREERKILDSSYVPAVTAVRESFLTVITATNKENTMNPLATGALVALAIAQLITAVDLP
jgi:hypothetical protein